jgi:DNA-binding HxlR family transcriptional regulator
MGFQQEDFCPFTKALEHLGDRWSLLIIRELVMMGPQGFNDLADGLPGRISRSILAGRLRNLEELGLVARTPRVGSRVPGYCVTAAGEQLRPMMNELHAWAKRFVPEDPAVAERDPDLILWWLVHRIDTTALPQRQVVVDLEIRGTTSGRFWLVLERGAEPSSCLEDPELGEDRYVYVESDATAMYPIAKGLRSWSDAIADRSVRLFGDPELVRSLPGWFRAAEPALRSVLSPAVAVA